MKQIKEKLNLLNDIEESQKRNIHAKDNLHLTLMGQFQERNVLNPMVSLYKEVLIRSLIPKQIEDSNLLPKVLENYNNWLQNVEINEYFVDAWGKIFEYQKNQNLSEKEDASWWNLEQIYYEVVKILKKENQEKPTFAEDEFLGNFRTCFPNVEDISDIHFASKFFHQFTIMYYTVFSYDEKELTSLEKIKLVSIWKEYFASKEKGLIKERVKK